MEEKDFTPQQRLAFTRALATPQAFAETFLIEPMSKKDFVANFVQRQVFASKSKVTWLCCHRRAGKALPLDTIVHTPTGEVYLGDLKVGDEVLTPDGSKAPITFIHEQGQRQVYRLHLSDGTTVDSCAEHEWEVCYHSVFDIDIKREWEIKTTKELADYLANPTEPYFAWYHLRAIKPTYPNLEDRKVQFREFVAQRAVRGSADVSTVELDNLTLEEQKAIVKLARSLGCKVWEKADGCVNLLLSKELDCKDRSGLPFLSLDEYCLERSIIKIDVLNNWTEMRCLTIDHPDHLFLVGDYIPTHNCIMGDSLVIDGDSLEQLPISKASNLKSTLCFDFESNSLVKTSCQWIDSGFKDCLRLYFANGSNLGLSADHLVFSRNKGWVRADSLKIGDRILGPSALGHFGEGTASSTDLGLLADMAFLLGEIPSEVFCLSKDDTSRFLLELWQAKGRLFIREQAAVFMLWNEQIAKQLQLLLLKFGVESRADRDGNLLIADSLDTSFLLRALEIDHPVYDTKSPRRWEVVTEIHRLGRQRVYDLSVEHDDHNFIANGLVVHNSFVLSILAIWHAVCNENKKILVYAPSAFQLDEIFVNIDAWISQNDFLQAMRASSGNTRNPQIRTFNTGSQIHGFAMGTVANESNKHGKRGGTADVVIVDEASEMGDEDWRVIDPIIQGDIYRMDNIKAYIAGTIRKPMGRFFERVKKIGSDESNTVVYVPITENPDYTPEQVERRRLESAPEAWYTEWLLEVGETDNSVFRKPDVDLAFIYDWEYGVEGIREGTYRFIGVDWDKSQAGSNIVVIQYEPINGNMTIIYREEIPSGSFTYDNTVNKILELMEIFTPTFVVCDAGHGEYQWERLIIEQEQRGLNMSDRIIKLAFNSKVELTDPQTGEMEKKLIKPFLVRLLDNKFQKQQFFLPTRDEEAKNQFLTYRIKTVTENTIKFTSFREHIIDGCLFCMYAIFMYFENEVSEWFGLKENTGKHITVEELSPVPQDGEEQLLMNITSFQRQLPDGPGIYRSNLTGNFRGGFDAF